MMRSPYPQGLAAEEGLERHPLFRPAVTKPLPYSRRQEKPFVSDDGYKSAPLKNRWRGIPESNEIAVSFARGENRVPVVLLFRPQDYERIFGRNDAGLPKPTRKARYVNGEGPETVLF